MGVQTHKQILGQEGERIAEIYLRKKGYRVVERNYRCPVGELDLILLDRRVVVFVEVKTRTDDRFGAPLESVGPRKQKKMIKTALFFLTRHQLHNRDARFDVVGISLKAGEPVVDHVQNAFEIA